MVYLRKASTLSFQVRDYSSYTAVNAILERGANRTRADLSGASFTEFRGPEGKHPKRALPSDDDGASSASHSSRSSVNQVCNLLSATRPTDQSNRPQTRFRELLMMRDGGDYFSQQPGPLCVAAHLVPHSRPDVCLRLLKRRNPPLTLLFGSSTRTS
jgi:hypothetical protein